MDDNDYRFARIVAICACVFLTCSVVSCNADSVVKRIVYADTLNKATEKGASPLVAGCAWGTGGTGGDAAICAAAVK